MYKPTTIKDIARALGLSTSTVSRALRDSYEISEDTKRLVMDYAEKIHYKPNPIALSLKERRSYSIGVIVCEVANSFFSQAINGIESIAYNKGYHVIISQSHDSYEREVINVQVNVRLAEAHGDSDFCRLTVHVRFHGRVFKQRSHILD